MRGRVAQVEEYLYVISKFLLDEEGSRMLSRLKLTQSARGLLVERAAARISFQPRFLTVEVRSLLGAEAMRQQACALVVLA